MTPIEIGHLKFCELEMFKKKMLLMDNKLFIINDFFVETVNEIEYPWLWGKAKNVKKYYLHSISIFFYSSASENWVESISETLIRRFLVFRSISEMRNDFLKEIKDPLEKLGFNLGPQTTSILPNS